MLGVCSERIAADFNEGNGRSLHQLPDAWTICLNSDCSGNMNWWTRDKPTASGLPGVAVGGLLEIELNCDKGTLEFMVNGRKTAGSSCTGLPSNTKLFPCAAFGGDGMKRCTVQLSLVTSFT